MKSPANSLYLLMGDVHLLMCENRPLWVHCGYIANLSWSLSCSLQTPY